MLAALPITTHGGLRYAAAVVAQDKPTNEALMEAYIGGDQAAFRLLFERYAPTLLRLGRRHLDSEAQAQELVQHTFMRLHGARRDFTAGSRVHPWLMTIAMNYVRDQWRARKRRPTEALTFEPSQATEADPGGLERKERAQRLRTALETLPESHRAVIELFWFQDRNYAEIAEILGTTPGAARVRAHRAGAQLRKLLESDKRESDVEG